MTSEMMEMRVNRLEKTIADFQMRLDLIESNHMICIRGAKWTPQIEAEKKIGGISNEI